jgi:hypothetical protein
MPSSVGVALRHARALLVCAQVLVGLFDVSRASCMDGQPERGISVQTWLDESATCAPVEEGTYTRAAGRECPIQHYYLNIHWTVRSFA